MPGAREWMAGLILRAPAPLRSLRDVPLLGNLIHRISHRVVPGSELVWSQVEEGPARGMWLKMNPRTGQGYLRGEVEAAVQKAMAERLQPGMIFYDLGANIGLFSLLAARIVGPSGRVFSFEPDSTVAARLKRNVERNGFANVTVVEKGIWSSSGDRSFTEADASSPDRGVGRITEDESEAEGIKIQCVALDDFVKSAPAPDAIKCDIEGAEVEALCGAENLLRERRPWIVCEMHSAGNDMVARRYLTGFGYHCKAIDEHHVLAFWPAAKVREQSDAVQS